MIVGIYAALLSCPSGQSHYSAIHSSDDDVWWINKEWLIDKASNYDSNSPHQLISNSIFGKLLSKQIQTKEQSIMTNSNSPYQFLSNSISGKLLYKQTQTKEQLIMINRSDLLITRFFEMYTDYTEYKCEYNLVRVYVITTTRLKDVTKNLLTVLKTLFLPNLMKTLKEAKFSTGKLLRK